MKKFYIYLSLFAALTTASAKAQSLYNLNNSWLDLESFKKSDTAATDESDFKKSSKFCCRFYMPTSIADAPQKVVFKGRTYRIIDESHIGVTPANSNHEIQITCNSGDNKLDEVPGNNFFIVVSDGVVLIQRFDEQTGYRITKYDEFNKVRMKQSFPHTRVVQKDGNQFKQPYLTYLMHTDRYLVFSSLNSHDIHKTIIVDLKDGKATPIESSICGAIRSADEKSLAGYLMRDDKIKALSVSSSMGKWSLKENNLAKTMGETLINDTMLVMARYYKASPGVSLAAFNIKTGKVLWVADVKKPTAGQNAIYLSQYKNKVLLEGNDTNGNYLQAFDIATGKRAYSSI